MLHLITDTDALASIPTAKELPLVAVHNGIRHADECGGLAVLTIVQRTSFFVVRTRNEELIKLADIVVDVGGEYSYERLRFDHHQEGAPKRDNGVPYAAFGLVWKHYGCRAVQKLMPELLDSEVNQVVKLVDLELIQGIDASDNGVGEGSGWGIPNIINSTNASWYEEKGMEDESFLTAVDLMHLVLVRCIKQMAGKVLAEAEVIRAIMTQRDEPQIVVLDKFVPWQDAMCQHSTDARFVVFPESGTWMVQCVPVAPKSFAPRKTMPAQWSSLRNTAFAEMARRYGAAIGDTEAIFCHKGRWICGATTFEGAMQLARACVQWDGADLE